MLDFYNASKIARMEYEERIRSVIPPYDFEDRLKDDRLLSVSPLRAGVVGGRNNKPVSLIEQVGRLVYAAGNGLASLGASLMQRKSMSLGDPHAGRE